MTLLNETPTTEPGNVSRSTTAVTPLTPHLATLVRQASEQASRLSTALETQAFLDSMLEPVNGEDTPTIFVPLPQLLVLKHALNTDMQQQVKALAHTTDALCACASEVAGCRVADA